MKRKGAKGRGDHTFRTAIVRERAETSKRDPNRDREGADRSVEMGSVPRPRGSGGRAAGRRREVRDKIR